MFEDMAALYNEEVRRHVRSPAHARRPDGFDRMARGDNPMCGDRVTVFVRRDGEAVAEAGFEARGCEICVASADMMCEAVGGLEPGEIRAMAASVRTMAETGACPGCGEAVERMKALSAVHEFPSRLRCVTLPWAALQAALDGRQEASHD